MLIILGPAKVRVAHDDRSRPCEHVFRIYNPTPRPIVIERITTSCTCTVATPIEGPLGAGQVRDLRLQVNRFDPYSSVFSTTASIETDAGTLDVKLFGALPPSRKVLCKPQVLYLKPDSLARDSEHLITVRLLRSCVEKAEDRSIRVIGGPAEIGRITEADDGPHYAELTIPLILRALTHRSTRWEAIEIDAGCEAVSIPIVVLGEARD